MEEHNKPIFLVCTANRMEALEVEFLRRFDDIFAVDLPHAQEREQIASVLIKREGRDPKKFDLAKISAATVAFTGAEIFKAIKAAMFTAYSDNEREFTTADIVTEASQLIPSSKSNPKKLEAMRKYVTDGVAKSASVPETKTTSRKISN
jgi:SpoVK/Ycf46/Vps4 family AAA+-type ATPase